MDRHRDWLGRLAHDLAATRAELVGLLVLVVGGILLTVLVVTRVDGVGAPSTTASDRMLDPTRSGATAPVDAGPGAAASGHPVEDPGGPSTAPTEVVVHVTGAVAEPGVLALAAGSRLVDAVEAAGGLTGQARPDVLNLAAPVVDGQRLHVPTAAELATMDPQPTGGSSSGPGDDPSPSPGPGVGAGPEDDGAAPPLDPTTGRPPTAPPGDQATTADGLLDLNLAGVEDLEQLPGVGPVLAGRILAWRDEHGGFTAVGQLREVAGIGEKTFQALAPLVTVS